MKKILLIISAVAVFSLHGFSQSRTNEFGVKIGTGLCWAGSGSEMVRNEGVHFGADLGLIGNWYFTKHIALSTGLNFNYMRMKYQFTDYRSVPDFLEMTNVSVSRRVKGTYLEVPLKIKVKAEIMEAWSAYVDAGIGLGFNLSDFTKDEYEFYWVQEDEKIYSDRSYQYRVLQPAINVGLGAEYEINRSFRAFAQLSFNHALTNTFTKDLAKQTGSIINTNFIGLEFGILY